MVDLWQQLPKGNDLLSIGPSPLPLKAIAGAE
jgi:hypothetical protein